MNTELQNPHHGSESALTDLLCADFIDSTEDKSSGGMARLRIYFKNGLELSIIRGPYSYGGEEGLFEIAPYSKADGRDGDLFDEEDQGDEVCGYCDLEKVTHYIQKLGTM